MTSKILVVDDDAEIRELACMALGAKGFAPTAVASAEAALEAATEATFDAIVTDVHMDGIDGIELCRRLHAHDPELPVVVITGKADVATAVAALRAGAYDFLEKPIDIALFVPTVERAAERRVLGEEVRRLRKELEQADGFEGLIGRSGPMRRLFELMRRVADAEAPILITGETGTGKELVARGIHRLGRRSEHPFVAINCAAIPSELLESELFGHKAGAFTDAKRDRAGLFVQAGEGTVFLDEVAELPIQLQPKLLRALQEGTVRPVGATEEEPFRARVLTATNREIEDEVAAGRFREDLLYRIDVVRMDLPPLRLRARDVLLLAQSFLDRFSTRARRRLGPIDATIAERLLAYGWPGNVRELENCIERAVALAAGDRIALADLPAKVREHRADHVIVDTSDAGELLTLEEFERRYIASVIEAVGNNKTRAAEVLGIDRRTLHRRMERNRLE